MTTLMQVRRGNSGDRPTLNAGEFGLDTDTDDLWIGTSGGNLKVYPPVVSGAPAISGTPVANQLAYWTSAADVGGLADFAWDAGSTRAVLGSTAGLQWSGKSIVTAPDNGSLRLTNSAGNDSLGIFFGPATIAFPFLKRDADGLQVRIGTDADFGGFEAGAVTANDVFAMPERGTTPGQIVGTGQLYVKSANEHVHFLDGSGVEHDLQAPIAGVVTGSGVAGQVTFWDAPDSISGDTGLRWDNVNDLLQWGGTTSAFPAIARDGATANLRLRKADNTTDAAMTGAWFAATAVSPSFSAPAGGVYQWSTRTKLTAPAAGRLTLLNAAGTDFDMLQWGGTTSAFPALARYGATSQIVVRNADSTADATLRAGTLISTEPSAGVRVDVAGKFWFNGSTTLKAQSDGRLTLLNAAATDFDLLQFGGTGAGYPAIARSGAGLYIRTADNLSFASVDLKQLRATDWIQCGAPSFFNWSGSSRLYAPADGEILLTNSLVNDFDLLVLGTSTATGVALRKATAQLDIRTGDNLNAAALTCGNFAASGFIQAGAGSQIRWATRSELTSPSDGIIVAADSTGLDFNRLCLGGVTNSFPAWKRVGTQLHARLADDAAFAAIFGSDFYVNQTSALLWGTNRSRVRSPLDGNITLLDAAESDFGLLQFGGTTAAYPAVARDASDTDALAARKADNSAYAGFNASYVHGNSQVTTNAAGTLGWLTRAQLTSPADGEIALTDAAGTSLDFLYLGPSGSATNPALKVIGTQIAARRADDLAYADLVCLSLYGTGVIRAGADEKIHWNGRAELFSPSTTQVNVRNSGDTAYASLYADDINSAGDVFTNATNGTIRAGQTGFFYWTGRSRLYSPADGSITLTDDAQADFSFLYFGQSGSALFPAIKRLSSGLQARLADDSDFASWYCENLFVYGNARVEAGSYYSWNGRAQMYSTATDAVEMASSSGTGNPANVELNEYASAADPAAPAANKARFYVRDNGSGKGELCVRFATGAVQVIATEP